MNKISYAVLGAAALCAPAAAEVTPAQITPVQAAPMIPVVVQAPAAVTNGSVMPSNTEIWLSLDNEVSSKKMKVGDSIAMRVSRDAMLGNYVVIPRNTPGVGHVAYRTGKGAFGKSAKFEFDIDSITLAGRTIPVSGHYRVEGQGNTGAAIGAVVAVGVFGAFVTGHSAVAAQGSEWKAATKEPITVSIAGAN